MHHWPHDRDTGKHGRRRRVGRGNGGAGLMKADPAGLFRLR
jgi:hypothetical protein